MPAPQVKPRASMRTLPEQRLIVTVSISQKEKLDKRRENQVHIWLPSASSPHLKLREEISCDLKSHVSNSKIGQSFRV